MNCTDRALLVSASAWVLPLGITAETEETGTSVGILPAKLQEAGAVFFSGNFGS